MRSGRKEAPISLKKSLLKKTLGVLGMVPFFMVVMGVAGALLTAMLISVFTLNLEGLQKSAEVLIEGIFLTSVLGAFGVFVPVALPLGVIAGFIMMFLHGRGNIVKGKCKDLNAIFGIAILVMVATTFVAYLGHALYSIFQSAMQMSSLGSYTGFAAGSLLVPYSYFSVTLFSTPLRGEKNKKTGSVFMRNLDCHQGTFPPQGGTKQSTPQGCTELSPGFTSRLPGLGIIIGLYLAWKDDPKSEYENRVAQRRKQSRGTHPADLDWWLADFDNDIDAD